MEVITLDPSEIAADRTELVITDFVKVEGLEWGDSEVAAYMSESSIGSSPVDYRIPNRTVTMPLVLRAVGATSFTTIRQQIQAKVALFQREGGWLKREFDDGTKLYLDIVNASLKFGGSWFQAERDFDIDGQLTLETVPDWYGDEIAPVLLTDDFSTNTIANYTFDEGSGTVSVSGGLLAPSSTAVKRFYHNGYGDTESDVEVTIRHGTGSSIAGYIVAVSLRRLDGNNYLYGQSAADGSISVNKRDAGTYSNLATLAGSALATTTNYWLRFRSEGNKLIAEHWTTDPALGGSPASSVTHTLTGADATKFGYGITGDAGIGYWAPGHTTARLDDFSIESRVYRERTNAELIFTPPPVKGSYPSRTRITIDNDSTVDQWFAACGIQSRYYDSAAALVLQGESLTAKSGSSSQTRSGASGGSVMRNTSLLTQYQPILQTGNLTHAGSYKLWARVFDSNAVQGQVSLRLDWGVGDLSGPTTNAELSPPVIGDFSLVNLGTITIPKSDSTQRWVGQISAKSTVVGDDIDIDSLMLFPLDEGYGEVRGVTTSLPEEPVAHDEFDQSAGDLVGKTAPVGGTWAGGGDANDFAVEATGHTLQRSAVSDTAARIDVLGSTAFGVTTAEVGLSATVAHPSGLYQGVVARYVDGSNYLVAFQSWSAAIAGQGNPPVGAVPARSYVYVAKVIAGTATALNWVLVTSSQATLSWKFRLTVNAAGGWALYRYQAGAQVSSALLSGVDAALATGGTLDDGKPGIYDYNTVATAVTRTYDNFLVTTPTTVSQAAIPASQSMELRHDSALREDTSGAVWLPVPHFVGDYPRMPPEGLEGRTARVIVRLSRGLPEGGADSAQDDTAARFSYWPSWLFVTGT